MKTVRRIVMGHISGVQCDNCRAAAVVTQPTFLPVAGPYKCPDCGIWWAGYEHRCQQTVVGTSSGPFVFRTWGPWDTSSSTSSTPMHFCEACIGWHGLTCPGVSSGEVIA